MATWRVIVAFAAILSAACAPDAASVLDGPLYVRTQIEGTSAGLRAEVVVVVEDFARTPPLGCSRFTDDTWISVGGQRLDIVTLGGVNGGGYCEGARAEGVLRPDTLATPAAVELGDDSGTRASPLWDVLEPRSAQLVLPADGVLRVGVPFVIQWSPDAYGFEFRAGLVDGDGFDVEVTSVAGRDITGQLVGQPWSEPDPDARPMLILHAEAERHPLAPAFVRTWTESWSIGLPVTIERETPQTVR
jgi:hypothetical protein